MKRLMGSVLVLLMLSGLMTASGAEPMEEAEPSGVGLDNAFVEMSAGQTMQPGEDSTWTYNVGFNHGLALQRDWGLGFQWGGRVTLRDDEPEYTAGVGLFQRDVDIFGSQMMWGLQGFWQNTYQKVDLAYVKPTLGWQLNDKHCFGLSGLWGKNEDRVKFRLPWLYKQEGVNQAGAFWGIDWQDDLTTEFMGGYQFNDIDKPVLGMTVAWQYAEALSLNLSGSSNFDGDYMALVGLCYDLGANGRTDRVINVAQDDEDDYTPLPLDSVTGPRYSTFKVRK